MKKSKAKKVFLRRLALLLPLMLLAGIAAWRTAAQQWERAELHPLSMAASRHVENVTCTGSCGDVLLVSDQQPDVQHYAGTTDTICSEAILWANKNGREDQIVFGGYMFVDGYQVNLPTQTFGLDVLNGADVEFTLPDSGSMFKARVKDTGEWDLLDSVECNELSCSGFTRVFTDRDAGRVSLYDTCSIAADDTNIYALYQAPELHGPGDDDTYLVGISLRALPSSGSTSGFVEGAGFERRYASSELVDDVVHVVADVGDATFEFDLVKDAK